MNLQKTEELFNQLENIENDQSKGRYGKKKSAPVNKALKQKKPKNG